MQGYQLHYIYFIDPKWRKRLTVPELPFSKIDELGAGMYKGERVPREQRHEIRSREQLERESARSKQAASPEQTSGEHGANPPKG